METLLVHQNIAAEFLPALKAAMDKKNVRLVGRPAARKFIEIDAATDADWDTEYLDYILSIKVVADINEAIEHINTHGSRHTDVILTENRNNFV